MKPKVCPQCSLTFVPLRSRVKYCSNACVGAAKRNKPSDVWAQVKIGAPDECWPWTGKIEDTGYGRMSINCRSYSAHRIAWEVANGISAGHLWVLHSCDNPPCCNPDHLRLGTPLDNAQDRTERHRASDRRGESHHLVKLTADAVREIRRRRAAGERGIALAAEFGVSQARVSMITRHPDQNWSNA